MTTINKDLLVYKYIQELVKKLADNNSEEEEFSKNP